MYWKRIIGIVLSAALLLSTAACTANPVNEEENILDKSKTYQVLFVGNSYTYYNDLWDLFADVAASGGYTVEVDHVTQGGYYLDQYTNPADPFGKELQDKLAANTYDYVFLQEQSTNPIVNYERFEAGAAALHGMITEHGAEVVLYQTWARETGSPALSANRWTNKGMTEDLENAYRTLGETLQVAVSPVGTAFYDVHTNHKDIDLYDADTTHPSPTGSYLAALCHYATVTGDDPRHVTFHAEEDDEIAAILKQAAYDAVFGKETA